VSSIISKSKRRTARLKVLKQQQQAEKKAFTA
jgi:hypothetical protein